MLYGECKRRLDEVVEFRALVDRYFWILSSGHPNWHNKKDQPETRMEINRLMGNVRYSCHRVGETCRVLWIPPPIVGGPSIEIDILSEIFQLHAYNISGKRVIDCLDRAIGKYEKHKGWLHKQRYNPLFWAKFILGKFLSVPFNILGMAGFDSEKIERSQYGKFLKAIMGLASFVAILLGIVVSLVTILDRLGLFETTKKALGF